MHKRFPITSSLLALAACGPTRVAGHSSDASGTSLSQTESSHTAGTSETTHAHATADSSSSTGGIVSPYAVEIAAGGISTCARSDQGEVRCWGLLVNGRVTFGDDEPASSAPAMTFAQPLRSLALGQASSCAIIGDGRVTCWGQNFEGTLGYGDTEPRDAPTSALVELPGDAASVSLDGCACALLEQGSVQCWGPTWGGITGTSGMRIPGYCGGSCYYPDCCIGDDELPSAVPPVEVGAMVAAIDVGTFTVCVLTPDGRVRNWGWEWEGGLGFPWPDGDDLGDDEVPAVAPDVDVGAVAVAVAAGHPSCALLEDGTLRCWGGPAAGYAANEVVGDDESPASMGAVPLPARVVAVDASGEAVCALLEDGAVYCWGDNSVGQLGLGHLETIGDDETPLDAGPVDLGGPAVAISVGMAHACAILDDGTIRCWGNNDIGQLGYGHTDAIGDDETPASAGPVPWLP